MIKRIDTPMWQSSITEKVYDTEVDAREAEGFAENYQLTAHGLDKYVWTFRQNIDDDAVDKFNRRENHIYRALANDRALSFGCEYAHNGTTSKRVLDGELELVMLINFGDLPPTKYEDLTQFLQTFYPNFIVAYKTGYMGVLTGLMAVYSSCRNDLNPSYASPLVNIEKVLFGYHNQLTTYMKEYGLQA